MNIKQITTIFFLLIVLLLVALYDNSDIPKAGTLLSDNINMPNKDIDAKIIDIINNINIKNKSIHSFACEDINILLKNKITFNARGELFYIKDRNLRLKISSFLGKEMDIGSNSNMFWFWSKRMRPSELNYSTYDNIGNTGLKTPFNPLWLKGIVGFDTIDTNNIKIKPNGSLIEIIRKEKNISGDDVTRVTVIDKERLLVLGHFLYENEKLVASSEVLETRNGCPYKILITWDEEDISMLWTFRSPQINKDISETIFVMPKITPKIDIGVTYQKF